jgi:hypothetical protein
VSNLDAYLGRARGLFISLADRLTQSERHTVDDLIEHGEPAEGMRALAWIIAENQMRVTASVVSALRELTAGLIDDADMPPGLDDCVAE